MLELADFLETLNPKLMSMPGGLDIFIYYEGIRRYFESYQETTSIESLNEFMKLLSDCTSEYKKDYLKK